MLTLMMLTIQNQGGGVKNQGCAFRADLHSEFSWNVSADSDGEFGPEDDIDHATM